MIYLITGVPGSGKTLYAVSTLAKKLLSEKIKGKNGVETERRLLVDGIPDLLLPHEPLAPMVEYDGPQVVNGVKQQWACEGDGLLNWPDWCKPGDIILIDEVQRYWRPRGMGVKPPPMIAALETHRHLGVDFIIISQNPMLIDQNVRRLIGRHQHVRRLFGMARAIIYDWDGCSMDVHRTRTATTTTWTYPKSAYKLYSSSVLHLKQRQKIPLWLAVPVLALFGMVAVAPTAFSTMSGAMSGKGVSRSAPPAAAPAMAGASAPASSASAPAMAGASAPASVASAPAMAASPPAPISGCISLAKHCVCFDTQGVEVERPAGVCAAQILGHSAPGQKADIANLPESPDFGRSVVDAEVLAFMSKNRKPNY